MKEPKWFRKLEKRRADEINWLQQQIEVLEQAYAHDMPGLLHVEEAIRHLHKSIAELESIQGTLEYAPHKKLKKLVGNTVTYPGGFFDKQGVLVAVAPGDPYARVEADGGAKTQVVRVPLADISPVFDQKESGQWPTGTASVGGE